MAKPTYSFSEIIHLLCMANKYAEIRLIAELVTEEKQRYGLLARQTINDKILFKQLELTIR